MEWISVKDKLPDKPYTPVIVATSNWEVGSGYIDFNKRFCQGMHFVDNVTHWMRFPELPYKRMR